ncbi:MAG: redoxin domain-containing protein [Bacteroidales bacterium]|jgi:thiol-disulfide isomerase/thioredoxin|nr:redoxin domain-containing protein [Bacteroidales bacterium]HOI32624.1 redoxin domain-containing protein [Bacteroidales bacterium]
MARYLSLFTFIFVLISGSLKSQVNLEEPINFTVKTLDSELIELFPLLEDGKIVVINFFSTSCGPCQTFAHDFQIAYENFGENQSNVYFYGINYNGTNYQVAQFADIYQLFMPLSSGLEGGGNAAFELYETTSYPTVFILTPDGEIFNNYVWEPTSENITNAVIEAGGMLVGSSEIQQDKDARVFPNPASHQARLVFNLDYSTSIVIKIFNTKGVLLHQAGNMATAGENYFELPVFALSSGTYFVVVEANHKALHRAAFLVK